MFKYVRSIHKKERWMLCHHNALSYIVNYGGKVKADQDVYGTAIQSKIQIY